MLKSVLIMSLISFCSHSVYGQQSGSMESNRFSYVSIGQGIHYTAVKVGYDFRPNFYLELQSLTDGGGIWKESNSFNDWRVFSFIGATNVPLLRSEFRVGIGIMQTRERGSSLLQSMGAAPQITGMIHVCQRVAIGASVIWPISSAPNLILPTNTFCIEYRIGRYVKENGLH